MMYLRSHLFIPPSMMNDALRKKLSIPNPQYGVTEGYTDDMEPEYFLLYKEVQVGEEIFFRIPRYALGDISALKDVDEKVSDVGAKIVFKPKKHLVLNAQQQRTIAETAVTLRDKWGAVIVAKTGEGKTTMAIRLLCMLERKTLILVHKEMLIKQWRSELLALTDLKKTDIGLLQQGKFRDGKVVIGTLQSLMRMTIGRDINAQFGMVICDEVHRVAARQFLKAFTRFNAQYRLGLSATPERDDHLEHLYYLHLSENLIQHESVRNVAAQYMLVEYETRAPWRSFPWLPYREQVLRNLIMDEKRNEMLFRLIQKCRHRKILVLSDRIKHLKMLLNVVQAQMPEKKVVRFFGAESLTKKQRAMGVPPEHYVDPPMAELQSADIILATYGKAKEGINVPHLDMLIYATPVASRTTIIQSKGRIEREQAGKAHPIVVDIVDEGNPLCSRMAAKRERLYVEQGMQRVHL